MKRKIQRTAFRLDPNELPKMLEFTDYIYIGLYDLVILVLKEIIEYVFITRKGGNVINIEETKSNTKTCVYVCCIHFYF